MSAVSEARVRPSTYRRRVGSISGPIEVLIPQLNVMLDSQPLGTLIGELAGRQR
jgi:hypothetical protein